MAAKVRGRLGARLEKYGVKDIEMMKALIDGGTPIKDVAGYPFILEWAL